MNWFDINHTAFTLIEYPLSYIELLATAFGLLSVYLASKANTWTWPTGIINEIGFFILFFQVQLYSDMLLQVYFFIVTLYGWYYWKNRSEDHAVSRVSKKEMVLYSSFIVIGTIGAGSFMNEIHYLLPSLFQKQAAYPYADAFTTSASIVATILLSRKQIETWILWIAVDIVSVFLYFSKGIHLVMIEYVIFLTICCFGLYHWRKQLSR